ncbi:terminase small subunit [Shigella phage Buco]|uniref:Terminase small subunit n=1 Tax=Shigella phage Buco TaxID=2530183 RepID=A0A482JG76_9CAUD|nr:terminase small subunit [Shigella phage Buco]QBP32945.1 terminase small subunit [Shigella phage Buco]
MAKAATKSRLSELHRMFTEALIDELEQAHKDEVPLPAADKSVIAKFLKDNDITADADSSEMQELRDEFSADLDKKRKERAEEIFSKMNSSPEDDITRLLN